MSHQYFIYLIYFISRHHFKNKLSLKSNLVLFILISVQANKTFGWMNADDVTFSEVQRIFRPSRLSCFNVNLPLNLQFCLLSVVGLYYLLYLPKLMDYYVDYSWKFYGFFTFEILLIYHGILSPLVYIWHNHTFRQRLLIMYLCGTSESQNLSASNRT